MKYRLNKKTDDCISVIGLGTSYMAEAIHARWAESLGP